MKKKTSKKTVEATVGKRPAFAFFGTGEVAVYVLEELLVTGFVPALIVTAPDKLAGRGKTLTPPHVKVWADTHSIPTIQPDKLDSNVFDLLHTSHYTLFIVADYGKILPKEFLDIPPRGVINMHPSLLPRLRGPSPIRSAILNNDKNIGVSVMLLDEKMDHGPILAQRKIAPPLEWPPRGRELDQLLAREGGRLLAETVPRWLAGHIEPHEQNHDLATYSEKIKKEDGLIDLKDDSYKNLLKIRSYDGWPGAYTFVDRNEKKVRVRITDAHVDSRGALVVNRVIPEGKKEMSFRDFNRGKR